VRIVRIFALDGGTSRDTEHCDAWLGRYIADARTGNASAISECEDHQTFINKSSAASRDDQRGRA
jgi:hypothetical protein